jgi:hypothetical protein
VKEQAQAIPLGEASVLYLSENPAAMLMTATQILSVQYAQFWQRESKRTPLIQSTVAFER